MSTLIFCSVLLAALLHAGWNLIVKSGEDKRLDIVLVAGGAGLISAVLLPFLAQPAAESWPYIAASSFIQPIYYLLLAAAYRTGDMSEAYPLMRGTAPLLVAMASGPFIGEALPLQRWMGIALICSGVFSMALAAHRRGHVGHSAVPYALANAVVIAGYTLIDGIGARKSGAPAAYTLWIFASTAIPPLVWGLSARRADLIRYARARLHLGFIGGAATIGSYGLALFAMTAAPVALVAALRETSILFVTVIAVFVLRERIGWKRYVAIALIAYGAITIRFA